MKSESKRFLVMTHHVRKRLEILASRDSLDPSGLVKSPCKWQLKKNRGKPIHSTVERLGHRNIFRFSRGSKKKLTSILNLCGNDRASDRQAAIHIVGPTILFTP
jgi:hypothetical protein